MTDFVAWIRNAAKDPTMSYAMKEKAKADWVTARQYLSETDEAWGERLVSLADALEDSGVARPLQAVTSETSILCLQTREDIVRPRTDMRSSSTQFVLKEFSMMSRSSSRSL